MVQGQFCGDCLYMRYGEHVVEARQNPNWLCPVCRGICNCSLCRQAKGWPPTGPLYKKVSKLGFKSVAHYLIQTCRLQAKEEETSDSLVHASAKRSLPFSDIETVANVSPVHTDDDAIELPKSESDPRAVQENSAGHVSVKRSLPFSGKEAHVQSVDDVCSAEHKENCGLSKPKCEQGIENGAKDLNVDCTKVVKRPKPVAKRNRRPDPDPSPDSIGGRLRLRRRISKGNLDELSDEGKVSDVKKLHEVVMENDEGEEKEIHCVSD
ncbi:zf-4CXXC_R1 domain-containing protein [Psidium guajava]|nr:zf-4CXXC_R1 domain-containing protein [Psidium guajava]